MKIVWEEGDIIPGRRVSTFEYESRGDKDYIISRIGVDEEWVLIDTECWIVARIAQKVPAGSKKAIIDCLNSLNARPTN